MVLLVVVVMVMVIVEVARQELGADLKFKKTTGRTLEELDEIFDAPNPRKASTAKHTLNRQTVRDQRTGVEKEEVFVADQQPAVA